MTRDMKTILTRLFTVLMLIFFSMGAEAQVKVLFGEEGTEKFEGKGGTIEVKQEDSKNDKAKITVTLIVTPDDGYKMEKDGLEVYAVISPDGASTRALEISGDALKLDCDDFKDVSQKRTYTVDINSKLALWVKSANFLSGAKVDPEPTRNGYSGVYYISGNNQGQNSYNVANTTTNYYLCPTENWIYYKATNNITTSDNGQPFLTTYQYRNGTNDYTKAVWIIIKHPTQNYYYIIHAKDGKYMTSNGGISGSNSANRIRVHLEETNSPTDNMLFDITKPSYYDISPKNNSGWFLNITQGNRASLQGTGDKTDGPSYTLNGSTTRNVGGTIGLWNKGDDYTSKWYFEDAKAALTPTIDDLNTANNTFTITSDFIPTGCSIVYTTDGSDPSTSNGTTYTSAVSVTSTITIKAAVVGYGMVLSNIDSKSLSPVILAPTVTNNYDGTISLSTATAGTTIYYTTNGDAPDNTSTVYSSAFSLGNATVIKAIAYLGSECSEVTTYNVPQYTAPTISFNSSTSQVAITSEGTVYYTTDGSTPTTSSSAYSAPFTVTSGAAIKAIATHAGYLASEVASFSIVLTPTITLDGMPCIYDGTAKEPTVSSVKVGETTIDPSEYTVSYSNNINAGSSATVTITDNEGGDYYVAGSTTFTINPLSIGGGSTPASDFIIDVSKSGDEYVVTVKYGETTLVEGTDYTKSGSGDAYSYTVTVTGIGNYSGSAQATYIPVTPGYYALHQNGTGYLKVSSANVTLANDENLQYADLYNNGNIFWTMTEEGYLQNNVYYLNVSASNELYLSVEPITRWSQEDIGGDTHGKKHIKYNDLYLCNDNGIKLSSTTTKYYNACPVSITQKSWSDPNNDALTVQSPQLVTYLRYYFTQKIDYEFYDDGGSRKSDTGKDRKVYATLEYASGGSGKGTKWDITEDGVIYSKQTDDVTMTATYDLLPADAEALRLHPTAKQKEIKFTIKQKPFAPVSANYLLFSISGGDNYRYPFDDGISEGNPIKSNGEKAKLTDPVNDQISWAITKDDTDFYYFKNVSSGRYLYYNELLGDYGEVCVGTTDLTSLTDDNLKKYKFRLFKTSHSDYGTCYYIIPYNKLFAVYNNENVAVDLFSALNVKDYKSGNFISLRKCNGDSQWCIYKYEMEYRLSSNFNIGGETTVSTTGDHKLTAKTFYFEKIIECPNNKNAERALEVNGSYNTSLNYTWTVTGLDDYVTVTSTPNPCTGTSTLTINVTSIPVSSVSGNIALKVRGGDAQNAAVRPYKWLDKSVPFTILGNTPGGLEEISSLSGISDRYGTYKLKDDANVAYSSTNKPAVDTFSGILDGNGKTITGLDGPLFTNLTNGTVRNVNLSGVNITSNSGPTGAIAGTADGGSRIYNVGILDGSVGSSDDVCGGLVGKLDGSARVINCFSYADITGGTTVGGIVGDNRYKTKANDARTMVMNCMFYGDITGGTSKAPIYNGEIISNAGDTGVGNYNYFWAGASYVKNINVYNCALAADTRYLQRFEFYRHLLNSHRELAAWWATNDYTQKDEMKKWVMEPSQIGSTTPFPILKDPGQYPSVVNYAPSDEAIDDENEHRNEGRKLTTMGTNGKLSVTISMGSQGSAPYGAPSGAGLKDGITNPFNLTITDKDPDHFNFNYGKVQLPYYNDYCTGNYTGGRVVTGWKVSVSGGANSYSTGADATATVNGDGDITLTTPYNFADRNSTEKDLFSETGRIYNQGAYFDVPEGVTSITIEPYWAKAVFLADAYADVVYNTNMSTQYNVPNIGGGKIYSSDGGNNTIAGETQKVFTTVKNAIIELAPTKSHTVYDNAIVLVGNFHNIGISSKDKEQPYTIMSADFDHDNEPDYSYILRFNSRNTVHPVRVDFINIPGLGMAQKSTGGTGTYNFGIMQPLSWFESTNTSLFRVTQLEYDNSNRVEAPYIIQGGIFEQWVSGQSGGAANKTTYFHVGGNVWFKEFHRGTHQDQTYTSKHPPVSVTGGDYDEFYLTGLYRGDVNNYNDNAECYINGGRFGIVAGTGMEGIGNATNHTNGNIIWQIQNADIKEFYAGGINAAHPIEGSISTVISGGYIKQFCGGPKFGDMNNGRTVTTNAENCIFDTYFGAGFGGNSYSRRAPDNKINQININWNNWVGEEYQQIYDAGYDGVETQINYQFLPMSSNVDNVCRLFVEYVKFSLATTHGVTSKLNGCTINNNFYGGGSLGKVDGAVVSELDGCKVKGHVFGAGYSASLPGVEVMPTSGFITEPNYDEQTGNFSDGVLPSKETNTTTTYNWEHADIVNSTETAINTTTHKLFTTVNLEKSNLGSVAGNVTLTIKGNSVIGTEGDTTKGNVYGGGEASYVTGTANKVTVNLQGNTRVLGNVFGGGDRGIVQGSTEVNIKD